MNDTRWRSDWGFRRLAELAWPTDYDLATVYGVKGRAAAIRRLARRHEGFCALETLARLRKKANKIAADLAKMVDNP